MSDQPASENDDTRLSEEQADASADRKAILVIFVTAVLMALHFVSGFSFDF